MSPYLVSPGGRREGKKVANALSGGRRTEHTEQAFLISLARTYENAYPVLKLLAAVPNGAKLPYRKNKDGQRYSTEANKLKAEGLRVGYPDLLLDVPRDGYHGLRIEMKWGRNKTSPEQDEMILLLREQGYRVEVCYGAAAAWRLIVEYLGLPAHLLEGVSQ